jgi:hypothetical protein
MEGNANFKNKTAFLRKHPEFIKFMYDIVDILHDSFSIDFDKSETIATITADTVEELDKLYGKYVKSKKKDKKKFIYVDDKGNPIKKPLTGYQLWVRNEFLPSCTPEMKGSYIKLGLASKGWNNLNEIDKQIWIDKAKTTLDEYEKKKINAQNEAIEDGLFDEPKPKKPMSAYFIYSNSKEYKTHIANMKFKSVKEEKKYSASRWKMLLDEEKIKYVKEWERQGDNYKSEMVKYNRRVEDRTERLTEKANKNVGIKK